jgi:hypothetical protein
VLVPGAGAAPPTAPRSNHPEDGVVSGQGQDLLPRAPACLARQPLAEHEAAATVTDARQVPPSDHPPDRRGRDPQRQPGFLDADPPTRGHQARKLSTIGHSINHVTLAAVVPAGSDVTRRHPDLC